MKKDDAIRCPGSIRSEFTTFSLHFHGFLPKVIHILRSLQPNGLPSALEQSDPDNYPQQYRWFPQRCGNDVLNMQSPKGDKNVHENLKSVRRSSWLWGRMQQGRINMATRGSSKKEKALCPTLVGIFCSSYLRSSSHIPRIFPEQIPNL